MLHPGQFQIPHHGSTQRFPNPWMMRLHPSTCNEKKTLAQPGNSSFCSLTDDREDQQDAADDNGNDDCSLSSPKVKHRNRVVELPNLDLEREEEEGGKARAEQRVAESPRGRARGDIGAALGRPLPKDVLTTAGKPCRAFLCWTLGTVCALEQPRSLPACPGGKQGGTAMLPILGPPRAFSGRATISSPHHGPTIPTPEHRTTLP